MNGVFVFILAWLAVLSAISVLTYSFFWFETANSPYLSHLKQASNGRILRMLLKGYLSSLKSMTLVVLCFPLSSRKSLWTAEPKSECALPPVIFLHGLYHNTSAWTFYRWWFRRAGFTNVYALGYSSWRYTFDELLQQLSSQIEAIARASPGKPPILIGHSLGGLLSRAYVESIERKVDLTAVITLGAPHQGSKLAVLGPGKLAQSLRYNGPLIARLEEEAKTPDIPCITVYSPIDSMVLPAEALQVAHEGWAHHECGPTSHVGMLYSKALAGWLVDKILSVCSLDKEGGSSE